MCLCGGSERVICIFKPTLSDTRDLRLCGLSQADGPRVSAARTRADSDPKQGLPSRVPFISSLSTPKNTPSPSESRVSSDAQR